MTDETSTNDRPEWLPEKFKTPQDLATAYSELEKNYAAPPDKYDLSKSKFLDAEHDAIKDLAQFAKSKRVPAEVMDKFQESVDKYFSQFDVDEAKETEKLGEKGKERIDNLNNFVKAHLDENQHKALMKNINTAESVIALEQLRDKFLDSKTAVPNGNAGSGSTSETMAEIQAEMNSNLDKYQSDPKYRKELQQRMEKIQNKPFVDKRW